MEKLLLVDGNSILNRAYYGIKPLTAPDGTPTNAVYGFLNILFKYLEEEQPDYLCVAFDVKAKTFRHKMYDLYKAQRKPAPEDFLVQLPLIKEVLSAMNCACIEQAGYEADDLIGTVSRLCDEKGIACRILSGDKDDLQLATETTVVKLVVTRMGKTETTDYDRNAVIEKYGVTPEEFIDVKGLMGDPSDNIPGVKGVGEKTAFSLIQNYHSIDKIYEDVENLAVSPSVKTKLTEDKESAFLSRTLATIDRFVPMEFDFDSFRRTGYDTKKVGSLFTRLNFKSFLQKLEIPIEERTADLLQITGKLQKTDGDGFRQAIAGQKEADYLFCDGNLYVTVDGEHVLYLASPNDEDLRALFANDGIRKCGYHIKEDFLTLFRRGIEVKNYGFDVLIAAYLAEPTQSSYDLETLCMTYLRQELAETSARIEDDGQIAMNFGFEPDDGQKNQTYADRTIAVHRLRKIFEEKLKEDGQKSLYYDVELPLTEVLASMQLHGVYVDKEALKDFGNMLEKEIYTLQQEIYSLSGEEFNINSPKQLGEILFGKLSLPGGKKNKNGYSTNAEVLNKLKDQHPIVNKVLLYRQMTKLQSTYVEGMLPMIDKTTGRIHSNFNQTVTATGRISSTEPNLQNIPVRTELGREIRKMFVAQGEDTCFVDADYSQIELRVLAHISGDETMCQSFIKNEDIHTRTASQVFGVPMEEVTPQMRSGAKAVNFGIVYGIGAFSLSQDLGISVKEADAYIKGYLHNYPKVDAYMKETVEKAKELGYVTTLLGRRRNMPELQASNHITRSFGERVAMNAPIQGTAADIIKIAMVQVYRRLKNESLKSRLILQVHDELIVETYPEELAQVKTLLKEEMEQACSLSVPLVVDMNTGKSWYDTK
ncbi:MAG: DNA polymerase I [Clostridia bacterium]|nr:DNA polymerase I [Clostridia bacterium]